MPSPAHSEIFLYRSSRATSAHGSSVSAYLVERRVGSKVVARIEPLGLVPVSMSEHELRLIGLRRRLLISGPWLATTSRRHARARVRLVPRTP